MITIFSIDFLTRSTTVLGSDVVLEKNTVYQKKKASSNGLIIDVKQNK